MKKYLTQIIFWFVLLAPVLKVGANCSMSVTITPDVNPICNGNSSTLTTNVTQGTSLGAPYNYTWDHTGSLDQGTNGPDQPIASPTTTTTYSVTVDDGAGCSAVSSVTITVENPVNAAGSITGTASVCQGQNGVAYSVVAITGATGYVWTLPTGASIASGSNTRSITVDFSGSASSGNITVKGTNSCGTGTASPTFAVTVNSSPLVAGTITGAASACQSQNGVAYSVPAITGATGYVWTLPTGASIASGTNTRSITVNFSGAAASGNITVYGTNTCGNGTASPTFAVTVNAPAAAAGTISGTATVCQGNTGVAYSVPAIANATGYSWTLPTGASIASGTNTRSITVNFSNSATGGNVTVLGTNGCGSGTISTAFPVTVNPLPAAAGTITGTAPVCQGNSGVAYSVPAINNATGYSWTLPTGASIASGANTRSITVDFSNAAVSGTIAVNGTNACGNGTGSTFALTVDPLPSDAGSITGSATVCQGLNGVTYSILAVANASSYVWTLPTGASIASGGTTSSITVNFSTSAVSGDIAVHATNACGSGGAISSAITVNPLPVAAGTITGTATVCQRQTGVAYSVPAISNATGYVWTLPSGATIASGANSSSITVDFSSSAVSGNITVYGTNTCGNGIASANFHVTVNAAPVVTTLDTSKICNGIAQNIVLNASLAGSFAWTVGTITGGITGATAGSGAGPITEALTDPSNATSGTVVYNVVPTATTGNCPGPSFPITVTVNPTPDVTSLSTSSICSGNEAGIGLSASAPSNFTWTTGTITGNISGSGSGASSDSINQVLTNPSSSTSGSVDYHVVPTSRARGGSCAGPDFVITITVKPSPVVTTLDTASLCNNTATNIALTASLPSTYTWVATAPVITGSSSASGSVINQTLHNPSNSATGTVIYNVFPTSGACTGAGYPITVTVYPTPVVTAPTPDSTCSGISPNITLTATTPSTFVWTLGTIAGGITGASPSSGGVINQILHNPSNSTLGSVIYDVVPTSTARSCPGASSAIKVTVDPTPVVTTLDTAGVCSNFGPNIALTSTNPSSFTWTTGTVAGGITGASPGLGSSINQTLVNPSPSSAGTVQYIVVPTSNTGSCVGVAYPITVTVHPTPSVTNAATKIICNNTSTNVSLKSTTTSSFSWTLGAISGGVTGSSSGSDTVINQTLVYAPHADSGTTVYNIVPTSDFGCVGQSYTVTVTVNPTPIVITANTANICSGSGPRIILTGSVPSSYIWTPGAITGTISGSSAGSGSPINQLLTNPSHVATANGTVVYHVVPTSAKGCAGPDYPITVTVKPVPASPNIYLPEGNTACAGTMGFVATTDVNSSLTYDWTGANISGSNGPDASYDLPSAAGTFNVALRVTFPNGCSTSHDTSVTITSQQAPAPSPFTLNNSAGFTLLTILDQSEDSYLWGYDDGNNNLQSDTLPAPINGNWDIILQNPDWNNVHYWVIIKKGNCWTKVYYNRSSVNSIANTASNVSVMVYPNPASDKLNIEVRDYAVNDMTVRIYNALGQEVQNSVLKSGKGMMDLTDITGGLYVVRVSMNNNTAFYSTTFIKQR